MKLRVRDSRHGHRFSLLAAVACGGLLAGAGCGGSTSNNNSGTGDAGAPDSGTTDGAATPDANVSDGAGHPEGSVVTPDGSSACPTPGPQGTQLVASTAQLVLDGVTSDGYAVYSDPTGYAVSAVPIAGGAPVSVGMIDSNDYAQVFGRAVLFSPMLSAMTGLGTLSAWTASGGAHQLSTSALMGYFDVAPDASFVAYIEGSATGSATLMVSSADGATKMPLASGIDPTNGIVLQFVGPTALVAAYTPAADGGVPDGGTVPFTIATFTGSTFTQAVLSSTADPSFAVNSAAGPVLVSGPTGLFSYPIAGGAGTQIDPGIVGGSGIGASGQGGLLTKSSTDVIYAGAGALKRSPLSAPAPVTLVPAGVNGVIALSPDETWALAYQNQTFDQNTGTFLNDVYLASAATPGTASQLLMGTTGTTYGSAFTADSKYALFFGNNVNFVGDFMVAPAAASSTPTTIAQNAWFVIATSGSKVVLGDAYNMAGSINGTVNLESLDLSNPSAKATVVAQADANFSATASGDKIVYTYGCGQGANAGVWVMPAP